MSGWVWGVDVDTAAIAIGALRIDDGSSAAWTIRWRQKGRRDRWRGSDDLLAMAITVERELHSLPPLWATPVAVAVENPMGRHRSPALTATWGAVMLVLRRQLLCPVLDVNVQSWKKDVIGFGNASKDHVRYWARTVAHNERVSEDENDALAIGAWMRQAWLRDHARAA